VLWKQGLFAHTLIAENPGGTLTLTVTGTHAIHSLHLEGPTEIIASVELD
jgi:hypothetical protein